MSITCHWEEPKRKCVIFTSADAITLYYFAIKSLNVSLYYVCKSIGGSLFQKVQYSDCFNWRSNLWTQLMIIRNIFYWQSSVTSRITGIITIFDWYYCFMLVAEKYSIFALFKNVLNSTWLHCELISHIGKCLLILN